jgi:hypothetical protein
LRKQLIKRLKTFRSDSMKKNVLSLAVAATVVATGAQADLYINPEKTGEGLIFPFYDAENGNATNFHIVNTTDRVVAAKIRFREYKASEEVLDFNVYLSPEDHFAFGVIMDPNGTGGAVITSDNTCTVPALGGPNFGFDGTTTENADGSITRIQPFTTFRLQTLKWVDQDPARTLRGYVEVLEMGRVRDVGNPVTNALAAGTQYASFATHDAQGMPANCDGLTEAWLASWDDDATDGMSAPAGGLYGLAYHINVEDAAAWGFEATAFASLYDVDRDASGNPTGDGVTDKHAAPGSLQPNFGQAAPTALVPVDGFTGIWDFSANLTSGYDAVSATMMAHQVMNDVQLNADIGGATDWVTTFPNKNVYTNNLARAITPFTDPYVGIELNAAGTAYEEDRACEPVGVEQWDREEATKISDVIFSPPPPGAKGNVICDEQTVVAWGADADSALNVERDLSNLAFSYTEGWARWTFNAKYAAGPGKGLFKQALCEDRLNSVSSACLLGLPTIGFGAYKYANGSMGNTLMNYGHANDHKTNVVASSLPGSGIGG